MRCDPNLYSKKTIPGKNHQDFLNNHRLFYDSQILIYLSHRIKLLLTEIAFPKIFFIPRIY